MGRFIVGEVLQSKEVSSAERKMFISVSTCSLEINL